MLQTRRGHVAVTSRSRRTAPSRLQCRLPQHVAVTTLPRRCHVALTSRTGSRSRLEHVAVTSGHQADPFGARQPRPATQPRRPRRALGSAPPPPAQAQALVARRHDQDDPRTAVSGPRPAARAALRRAISANRLCRGRISTAMGQKNHLEASRPAVTRMSSRSSSGSFSVGFSRDRGRRAIASSERNPVMTFLRHGYVRSRKGQNAFVRRV